MRIIISPAKKMRTDTDSLPWQDLPLFLPQAERLLAALRAMDAAALQQLWQCGDRLAREKGIKRIVGHYYPTAKNLLVRDFYATIGFEQTAEDEAGNRTFVFTGFEGYQPQCGVMEIKRV